MQHLVQFDSPREAPEHVFEGLRGVDPLVDVVWWGAFGFPATTAKGEQTTIYKPAWLVGRVYHDPAQRRQAVEGIELFAKAPADKKAHKRMRLWDLKYQGFHPVFFYPAGDLDSGVVKDFEFNRWIGRHEQDLAEARALYGADMDRGLEDRVATMREANAALQKDIWKYVWKGRRSVLVH